MDIKTIYSECFVEANNGLYFMGKNLNVVYFFDLGTKKYHIVGFIPEESIYKERLCSKIILNENKLFFIPSNAKKLWIYDLQDDGWKPVNVVSKDEEEISLKFMQGFVYNNKLFMIGCYYPAIVVLDLLNGHIEKIRAPYDNVNSYLENRKDCYFRTDYVIKGTKLYIASCISNILYVIDLDSYEMEKIEIGDKNNRYSGIVYLDNNTFLLMPRKKSPIVLWNEKNEIHQYDISIPEEYENQFMFIGGFMHGNSIILIGLPHSPNIVLNTKNLKCQNLTLDDYSYINILSDGRVIKGYRNGKLIIGEKREDYFKISNEQLLDYHIKKGNGVLDYFDNVIQECNYVGLEEFIKYLCM